MSKYMRMNTVLKNAKIFEDDSLDDKTAKVFIKKEPVDLEHSEAEHNAPVDFKNIKLKTEPQTDYHENFNGSTENSSDFDCAGIEYENGKYKIRIKREASTKSEASEAAKDPLEESYLDNIPEEKWNTPMKKEVVTEDSNPSPFNKELFKHFNLGEGYGSPEPHSSKCETRKSTRRSVFSRLSPYKKYTPEAPPETRQSVKKRLGPPVTPTEQKPKPNNRQPVEKETDPGMLARRQKQIDFGKNTIGYDNYIQTIPKNRRKREDAHTPDKFTKYSRRGWDGLIKQWRLKLHKYDPQES